MSLQYAGELIAAFIERAGGSVKGKISTESYRGTGAGLRSPTVAYPFGDPRRAAPRIEQLHRQPVFPGDRRTPPGGPVSLEKSLQVVNEMLAAHGLAAAIHLEEGSGISRNNHFSPRPR